MGWMGLGFWIGRGRVLTRMPEPGSPGSPCKESAHISPITQPTATMAMATSLPCHWRCQRRCRRRTLVPAGPWAPGGPALPCRGQGDIMLGQHLLVAQPAPADVLSSHDSPLCMAWGGSLPEVLAVPGLPGCPEGRKRWGSLWDGFSPGTWDVRWERRPRQCQQLCEHPQQAEGGHSDMGVSQ